MWFCRKCDAHSEYNPKPRYVVVPDDDDNPYSPSWIARPNNGGEVGDNQDIADELNNLMDQRDKAMHVVDVAVSLVKFWNDDGNGVMGRSLEDALIRETKVFIGAPKWENKIGVHDFGQCEKIREAGARAMAEKFILAQTGCDTWDEMSEDR